MSKTLPPPQPIHKLCIYDSTLATAAYHCSLTGCRDSDSAISAGHTQPELPLANSSPSTSQQDCIRRCQRIFSAQKARSHSAAHVQECCLRAQIKTQFGRLSLFWSKHPSRDCLDTGRFWGVLKQTCDWRERKVVEVERQESCMLLTTLLSPWQ